MAEHSVKLPEPRSDDSEDVVWGLSTAAALWARGERRDAVVWIRRAAEAAQAAGNPFRASELGMYLPELERALQFAPPQETSAAEESAPVSEAAPISSFEILLDNDTPAPQVTLPALAPLAPAPSPLAPVPSAAAAPVAATPPTQPLAAPAATPPTQPPAAAAPAQIPPTMPPAATLAAATPSMPPPPVSAASPISARQTPVPAPPVSSGAPAPVVSARPQPSVPRPKTIAPPAASAVAVPPRPPSEAPAPARAPAPAEEAPAPEDARGSAPPPVASAPVAPAPAAAAAPQKRKTLMMRTPILDPWTDTSPRVESQERRRRQQANENAARPRARPLLDEEDDILTSAPTLEETLGKKHQGGPVLGGTGLAPAPPVPAAAKTAALANPPPLPPRAPGAAPAGARPPPLPPAVANPTPAPPGVAVTPPPPSTKVPTPPPPPPVAPASQKVPTQPPQAQPAPASANVPSPPPPPPVAPAPPVASQPQKVPTQPPPAPVPSKAPPPPVPDVPDDDGWATPAPPAQVAAAPVEPARPAVEAPEADVVPPAPRPQVRKPPTIPPAPKLPTGALGKPQPLRPPVPPDEPDEDGSARPRLLTDTLPSGVTIAGLIQAEAEAAAARAKAATPPTPAAPKAPPKAAPTQIPPPPAVPRPAPAAPRPAPSVPRPAPVLFGSGKPPMSKPSTAPPPPAQASKSPPPPPPLKEAASESPRISNVELQAVEPFAQLPEDVQRVLVRTAIIEDLVPGEARTAFGAVLVVAGEVSVCAVNLDVPAKFAGARSFIASRGSLAEGVPVRIIGNSSGATISRWSTELFESALQGHSAAQINCQTSSDALQARIGLTLGALGQVELATREAMISRLEVRVLEPEETITEEDGPMPGLVFVVGGRVEILEGDPAAVIADVRPGDLLFPEALWAGAPAPLWSRASASGALLIVGDRKLAMDFAESVPVVGELLAR